MSSNWTTTSSGRHILTDPDTGMCYRVSKSRTGKHWELAVFTQGSNSSCDRRPFNTCNEAKGHAELRIQSDAEERQLARRKRRVKKSTPWGTATQAIEHGAGIVLFSTSDNDGFWLSAARNAEIPEPMRNADGWYQEDTQGCIVPLTFPELFTTLERLDALTNALDIFPDYQQVIAESAPAP